MIPISLRIRGTSDSQVLCRTGHRPASLSDPDRLTTGGSNCSLVGIKEQCVTTFNCIAHGILEVGVSVHAEKIHPVDDRIVRSIDPSSPCVDMAHGLAIRRGASDEIANLRDVIGDLCGPEAGVRVVLDTNGGDAV